jgi:stress-induced morphogen
MVELTLLKTKIEEFLDGSKVEILDPRKDGVHIKAVVTWKGFEGMSLIDQHKKVYAALKNEFSSQNEDLHALAIETKVK